MTDTPENDQKTALASERTTLARFRVSLALDRTTLAWIRTALTFATFGFGMIGYFRTIAEASHSELAEHLHHAAIHMGVALVIIGLIALALAALSQWKALRKLRHGEQVIVAQWPLTIALAVLLALLGLYALWSIRALWM